VTVQGRFYTPYQPPAEEETSPIAAAMAPVKPVRMVKKFSLAGSELEIREGGNVTLEISRSPAPTKKDAMEHFLETYKYKAGKGFYIGNQNSSQDDRDGVLTRIPDLNVLAVDKDQAHITDGAKPIGSGIEATERWLISLLDLPQFIVMDIDDTLLGRIKYIDAQGADQLRVETLQDRPGIRDALIRLAGKGVHLGFMSDGDTAAVMARVGEILAPEIAPLATTKTKPLTFYTSGMATAYAIHFENKGWSAQNDTMYSGKYRIPKEAAEILLKIVGETKEVAGKIQASGLVGKFYTEVVNIKDDDGIYHVKPVLRDKLYKRYVWVETKAGNNEPFTVKPRDELSDGSVSQISISPLMSSISADIPEGDLTIRQQLLLDIAAEAEKFEKTGASEYVGSALSHENITGESGRFLLAVSPLALLGFDRVEFLASLIILLVAYALYEFTRRNPSHRFKVIALVAVISFFIPLIIFLTVLFAAGYYLFVIIGTIQMLLSDLASGITKLFKQNKLFFLTVLPLIGLSGAALMRPAAAPGLLSFAFIGAILYSRSEFLQQKTGKPQPSAQEAALFRKKTTSLEKVLTYIPIPPDIRSEAFQLLKSEGLGTIGKFMKADAQTLLSLNDDRLILLVSPALISETRLFLTEYGWKRPNLRDPTQNLTELLIRLDIPGSYIYQAAAKLRNDLTDSTIGELALLITPKLVPYFSTVRKKSNAALWQAARETGKKYIFKLLLKEKKLIKNFVGKVRSAIHALGYRVKDGKTLPPANLSIEETLAIEVFRAAGYRSTNAQKLYSSAYQAGIITIKDLRSVSVENLAALPEFNTEIARAIKSVLEEISITKFSSLVPFSVLGIGLSAPLLPPLLATLLVIGGAITLVAFVLTHSPLVHSLLTRFKRKSREEKISKRDQYLQDLATNLLTAAQNPKNADALLKVFDKVELLDIGEGIVNRPNEGMRILNNQDFKRLRHYLKAEIDRQNLAGTLTYAQLAPVLVLFGLQLARLEHPKKSVTADPDGDFHFVYLIESGKTMQKMAGEVAEISGLLEEGRKIYLTGPKDLVGKLEKAVLNKIPAEKMGQLLIDQYFQSNVINVDPVVVAIDSDPRFSLAETRIGFNATQPLRISTQIKQLYGEKARFVPLAQFINGLISQPMNLNLLWQIQHTLVTMIQA